MKIRRTQGTSGLFHLFDLLNTQQALRSSAGSSLAHSLSDINTASQTSTRTPLITVQETSPSLTLTSQK